MFVSTIAIGKIRKQEIVNFWREYIVKMQGNINLQDVPLSNSENYLRIWTGNPVIEVWSEGRNQKGMLTHWVREVVPGKEENTNRYYLVKDKLDSAKCSEIRRIARKYSMYKMPSQEFIPGWQSGFDGMEYLIEIKNLDTYELKTYWTPIAQHGVSEAEVVQSFIEEILRAVEAENRMKYFQSSIPFALWTNDGASATGRITTYNEYLRMKLERNRYRKQKAKELQETNIE